jgi:hypothetical protein
MVRGPDPQEWVTRLDLFVTQGHGRVDASSAVRGQQKNSSQQRGVQSLRFACTFNLGDGPQSLIVVPEQGARVLNHKKAEIEMQAAKCVANCGLLESKR